MYHSLELQRRAIEAELAATIAVTDARCLYSVDGHRSMAAYLRAACNWSNGEVARFCGAARVANAHPSIGEAWAEGHIGASQVAVLSATHASKRVTEQFAEFIPSLLDNAERLPHKDFVTGPASMPRRPPASGAKSCAQFALSGKPADNFGGQRQPEHRLYSWRQRQRAQRDSETATGAATASAADLA